MTAIRKTCRVILGLQGMDERHSPNARIRWGKRRQTAEIPLSCNQPTCPANGWVQQQN